MPYDPLRIFRKLARNNRLANFRLHQACLQLSQEEFIARRVSFFPTLRATLNHIYTVDRFYIDALQGGTLGLAAFAEDEPFATMAELGSAQTELDEVLIAFVDGLDEDGLAATVNIHRGARIQQDRCDDVLSHLFQHQTHHRGQAHAMLSSTAIKPPQLDEFIVGDDAKARKDEMDALGWTEDDLMFPAHRPA
ncbi:damage-inducible protein DinB [Agrobacterium genomosp. 3]|uniref:DinB family protein n=1 Tax=Rhizobium/Agrobacterium group TaxID=227290 RepID=UPI001CD86941|nr:DinB family protein [Rhizobium rhizogenes]MCA1864288.1 damage-inducible protein DinB [Agrobacterium tomkonis]MCA1874641.1 damage-inducible protein DinB [Agrobacterium tumefaciens]MCA1890556.1 damage-inducible protein DinB [Agrobacterium tomkonis]MCZ7452198.1 DinB family protein [Rhizobium rhizogenes]